jgi:hypothetical protein
MPRRRNGGAYLFAASGTVNSFFVMVKAGNANTFSLHKESDGSIERLSTVCGARQHW